jgi:hypothetical protein
VLVLLFLVTSVAAVRGMWSPCGLSMLSSLNPVSERARGHRFWATACWYAAGAVAGGAVLGAGCALAALAFGQLHAPADAAWALALAGAAVAALSDARVGGRSLPIHPRQVDVRWLTRYRRWIYAAGFGAQIGSGFATYIMTAGVYLTALLAVLTGAPGAAFAAGVVFGLVRGSGVLVAGVAQDADRLRAVMARVDSWAAASAVAAFASCVGVAGWAAGELGGAPLGVAAVLTLLAVAAPADGRPAAVCRAWRQSRRRWLDAET